MKCIKLTYISPLHGSVQCEDLIEENYGRIDFGSEGVYALYNRNYCVEEMLTSCIEDLVDHIPHKLKEVVIKAVFGKYNTIDGSVFLATEIYVKRQLDAEEGTLLEEWITGQLSDGWGEGVEQNAVFEEIITVNTRSFNEDECVFEEDCYNTTAFYYIHPWCCEDWSLELGGNEEVELDIYCPEPIVHSSFCTMNDDRTYTVRTVYQVEDKYSAIQFIKNSGHLYSDELIRLIDEQGCLGPRVYCYVVYQNAGMFPQFLSIVGFLNPDTDTARLFEIDNESGAIDFQDFKDGQHKEFYKMLLNK